MKLLKTIIASAVVSMIFAAGVYAAAYIKFDGVDGESKSSDDRPTEEVAFYYNKISFSQINARVGGPLIIKDEQNKTIQLKKDGVYHTSRGERILVRNGMVAESTVSPPSAQTLRPGKTAQPAGMLLPAVQNVRDSPARNSGPSSTRRGNVESSWKVEKGEK